MNFITRTFNAFLILGLLSAPVWADFQGTDFGPATKTGANQEFEGHVELPNDDTLPAADCTTDDERGRIFVLRDTTSDQWIYICEGTAGWVLQGGAGASTSTCPAGDDGQVQYNDDGSCGADPAFIFNKTYQRVGIGTSIGIPAADLEIDSSDKNITAENVLLKTSSQTLQMSDGATISNQRQVQFLAPVINGVAGGSTETVTDSSTVYIDGPPTGSNITFTNGPFGLWNDCTLSGDCLNMLISNSQTNASGSTDETTQINWGFGSDKSVARIEVGKLNNFTSTNTSDAYMCLSTDNNDVLSDNLMLASQGATGAHVGVGIACGTSPKSALTVSGGATVGSTYASTNATDGRLYSSICNFIGPSTVAKNCSYGLHINQAGVGGGDGDILLQGTDVNDNPVTIMMGDETQSNVASIDLNDSATGSYGFNLMAFYRDSTVNGYFAVNNADRINVTKEDPYFSVGGDGGGLDGSVQSLTTDDGRTLTNQRFSIFRQPNINGVAGGSTETCTNCATVYIEGAPTGSNITITNPYSLWVDDGDVRFDGDIIQSGSGPNACLTVDSGSNFCIHAEGTTTYFTKDDVIWLQFDGYAGAGTIILGDTYANCDSLKTVNNRLQCVVN